ncbi:hypothetical protein ACFL0M_15800 [Thermodesulfobacteriota bacterium]
MKKSSKKRHNLLTAVVANSEGEVFELGGYAAVGMAGLSLVPLAAAEAINMPSGSELMFLPDRKPILFNKNTQQIETISKNPHNPKEVIFPVAVFNSPGYVITYVSAYKENKNAGYLPLFSFGAVGWYHGKFRSAAISGLCRKIKSLAAFIK